MLVQPAFASQHRPRRRQFGQGGALAGEQHFTAQVISNACKETLVEQQGLQAFALESFLADVLNQLLGCRLIDDHIRAKLGDVLVARDFPRLEHENVGGRPQSAGMGLG